MNDRKPQNPSLNPSQAPDAATTSTDRVDRSFPPGSDSAVVGGGAPQPLVVSGLKHFAGGKLVLSSEQREAARQWLIQELVNRVNEKLREADSGD